MACMGRLSSLYKLASNYDLKANTLLTIYKTQTRPIWEYALPIFWCPKARESFQQIQNYFLRLAHPTAKHTSIDLLHIIADIEPVVQYSWLLRQKNLIKFILAPQYHPLYQIRYQLQRLNNYNSRLTYSKKGHI